MSRARRPRPAEVSREHNRKQDVSRRQFLRTIVAGVGGVALSGTFPGLGARARLAAPLPPPETTGIEHVIVVMMENRSFDHYLGWLPGADGRQAGQTYLDSAGAAHNTFPLAPDYQGCSHPDPDHSFAGSRVAWNNGAADGWLRAGSNDRFAIGYYQAKDLGFLGSVAPQWLTCDRYFAPIMASTFPNRIYQHTGQTDRIDNSITVSHLPTIWDRLAEHGISGRYYFSDLPILALWGAKYLPISRPFKAFLSDCAAGTLPSVSFVDPRLLGESRGTSHDDHPHADIRNGEAFMSDVYTAVTTGPAWSKTLLVFNYDEWGGFFDHVAPPTAQIPDAVPRTGNHDDLRGFRVPAVFVAPWVPRHSVSHVVYDHTSILKLIEWRWNLPPLTIRDQTANNPAAEFNFSAPLAAAPQFTLPPGPFGAACTTNRTTAEEEWIPLKVLAKNQGWAVVDEDAVPFKETGHSLSGPFLAFWLANGGLPVFGFPLGPEQLVGDRVVQWLERARFELHLENVVPYRVQMGRLGVETLQKQGRDPRTFAKALPGAPHYFSETGHAITHEPFWRYWRGHGLEFDDRAGTSYAESLALFGLPVSEAMMEKNSSGDMVLTQWFERARFEYHPKNPAPYDVLLGRLGAEGGAGS